MRSGYRCGRCGYPIMRGESSCRRCGTRLMWGGSKEEATVEKDVAQSRILYVKYALGSRRPGVPLHWERSAISRRFANSRRMLYSAFSTEIAYLRGFMNEYLFLTLGIAFFEGLIVGGVLPAGTSQFVILTLLAALHWR